KCFPGASTVAGRSHARRWLHNLSLSPQQGVAMQTDLYTKIVLTVIAFLLFILVMQPSTTPIPPHTQPLSLMDVRIRAIELAASMRWEAIHVVCDNCK